MKSCLIIIIESLYDRRHTGAVHAGFDGFILNLPL